MFSEEKLAKNRSEVGFPDLVLTGLLTVTDDH